jgi:hypothetical protein
LKTWLERRRRCPGVAPPRTSVERGRVDDVRIQRIETDVGDAEAADNAAVPDLGERRAAVERLVEAGLVRAGLEASRTAGW